MHDKPYIVPYKRWRAAADRVFSRHPAEDRRALIIGALRDAVLRATAQKAFAAAKLQSDYLRQVIDDV